MTNRMFFFARTFFVLVCLVSLSACTHSTRTTARNVGIAGASGAAVGTIAALATGGGCLPCGAAIGLGVGAGMGWIFDRLDNRTPGR